MVLLCPALLQTLTHEPEIYDTRCAFSTRVHHARMICVLGYALFVPRRLSRNNVSIWISRNANVAPPVGMQQCDKRGAGV